MERSRLRSASEVRRGFETVFEFAPPLSGFFSRVESFSQVEKAFLELSGTHVFRSDVDVKERTQLPRAVAEEPLFLFETPIEGGARKRGQEGDLHFIQTGVFYEVEDLVENFRRVAIQSQ